MSSVEDEWLWGWDGTPGIVSVWAEGDGRATVWRRDPAAGVLLREEERFRPWLLLDRLDDLEHLGDALGPEGSGALVRWRELEGPGALRWLVSSRDLRVLGDALLHGASRRMRSPVPHLRELPRESVLCLPPDEQYLVATGRTYFRDLPFEALRRMQFDLETTGLDPRRDRIFMVAVREPDGTMYALEADGAGDSAEAALIARLVQAVTAADPDVIENHNLHGFDLPFLDTRARALGVPLPLGRLPALGLRQRGARRGVAVGGDDDGDRRHVRFVAPGRELIDTLDAVRGYDFATRDLPGHGLKAVARHLGIAKPDREYVPGAEIYRTWLRDPERVRRYATDDVEEVAALARMLGGAPFALARMAPRRYERLADAGAATGVIDPLLVRAYLRAGAALPAHEPGDGTPHSGAALHLFATGVARRVVKADVASLYPSLMRAWRIGPERDRLGALLAMLDRLVEQRLQAKALARRAPAGSAERHAHEATSAAMKIVVNSAYGYLAAGGELTRFADVHAANEVTRRGRETLALICRELAARGATLVEADTDGVYFSVPEGWTAADERRLVEEVDALLPPLVQLELEGCYAAMLSHEPKNYALLQHDGTLVLRGVAFRSSRAEPYGERFLRESIARLLVDDLAGVREVYLQTVGALRRRELPTRDVSSLVRLTKTPAKYAETRAGRRELAYEALLASGRGTWRVGERVRVYRNTAGEGAIAPDHEDAGAGAGGDYGGDSGDGRDGRDYDVDHYVRLLRDTYAARLARGLSPEDFALVFADPDQLSLFDAPLEGRRAVLTVVGAPDVG
ncbi:MAG TPA: ribonuclease H-like domain-containing protein [Gemmatimonadales bacterium]